MMWGKKGGRGGEGRGERKEKEEKKCRNRELLGRVSGTQEKKQLCSSKRLVAEIQDRQPLPLKLRTAVSF